ncbi:MAG: response regulator [Candidatus Hermodarchaeota archaeon]
MSFFIVDDDISVLEIYNKIFPMMGFNIIDNATNGEEAVIKFQKLIKKPDYIIMDYHMPHKNGIEATEAILELEKNAKIIIVSGDPSVKEEVLASGAICFKKKPFNVFEFIQQVKFCQNQKRM